jgi:hypothetical protein
MASVCPFDESWTDDEIRYSFNKFLELKKRGALFWVTLDSDGASK